jgi:hypothetical protein
MKIQMAELAKANNIMVIFFSVLPVYEYPWSPGLEPAEKIVKLNSMYFLRSCAPS